MKVTHIPLAATRAALEKGRPSLTPELLAAVGARYSRNPDGLDAILEVVQKAVKATNEVDAVNSVFRYVDYGHASIADMVPVAMFLDGLSIWMIYHIFSLTPTASGQETSTRYCRFDSEGVLPPEYVPLFGSVDMQQEYEGFLKESFDHYARAAKIWEQIAPNDYSFGLSTITLEQEAKTNEKAALKLQRLRKNYVFDRARGFIPVAALNNMMLIMSARSWVQLVSQLFAYPIMESKEVAAHICRELDLVAPHLMKHAVPKQDFTLRAEAEFEELVSVAKDHWKAGRQTVGGARYETTSLDVELDKNLYGLSSGFSAPQEPRINLTDLEGRTNRYSPFGPSLRSAMVRFGINGISFAETRDLNRHRTGNKVALLAPSGFYCALDQIPLGTPEDLKQELLEMATKTTARVARAAHLLEQGYTGYLYFLPIGFQHYFSHCTTADKFLYEMELRTGPGAHFRYASHMHRWLQQWYEKFPETKGLVLEGTAEPE